MLATARVQLSSPASSSRPRSRSMSRRSRLVGRPVPRSRRTVAGRCSFKPAAGVWSRAFRGDGCARSFGDDAAHPNDALATCERTLPIADANHLDRRRASTIDIDVTCLEAAVAAERFVNSRIAHTRAFARAPVIARSRAARYGEPRRAVRAAIFAPGCRRRSC